MEKEKKTKGRRKDKGHKILPKYQRQQIQPEIWRQSSRIRNTLLLLLFISHAIDRSGFIARNKIWCRRKWSRRAVFVKYELGRVSIRYVAVSTDMISIKYCDSWALDFADGVLHFWLFSVSFRLIEDRTCHLGIKLMWSDYIHSSWRLLLRYQFILIFVQFWITVLMKSPSTFVYVLSDEREENDIRLAGLFSCYQTTWFRDHFQVCSLKFKRRWIRLSIIVIRSFCRSLLWSSG